MSHLNLLLTSSEPGATIHHLHVVTAPASVVGPLGLPDPAQLHRTVYAIANDATVDAEQFITQVIALATVGAGMPGGG